MTYQTDSFLEKNRDYIVAEHCNLLSSSKCPLVSGLFTSLPEESLRSSYKFSSVASRFKVSRKCSVDSGYFWSLKYAYLHFFSSGCHALSIYVRQKQDCNILTPLICILCSLFIATTSSPHGNAELN